MSREWTAKWIGPAEGDQAYPVIFKDFYIDDQIKKATLYITGLGIFEAYVNGQRVGTEYLTPYQNADAKEIQYFSYDVTNLLNCGPESEANSIDVFLGKGWNEDERFALKAEFEIEVYKYAAEEESIVEESIVLEETEAPAEEFAVVEEAVVEEAAPETVEEPEEATEEVVEEAAPEAVEEIEEATEEIVEEAVPETVEETEEATEEVVEEAVPETVEEIEEEAAPEVVEEAVVAEAVPAAVEEPVEETSAAESEELKDLDSLLTDADFDELFDDDFLEGVISEEKDPDTIRETKEESDIEFLAMKGEELVESSAEPFELDDLSDLDDFLEGVIEAPKPKAEPVNSPETTVFTTSTEDEAEEAPEEDDLEIFDFEDWDDETEAYADVKSPGADIEVAPYSITDEELEAMFDRPVIKEAEPEEIIEEAALEEVLAEATEEEHIEEAAPSAVDEVLIEEAALEELLAEAIEEERIEEEPEAVEEEIVEETEPEAVEEEIVEETEAEAIEEEIIEEVAEAVAPEEEAVPEEAIAEEIQPEVEAAPSIMISEMIAAEEAASKATEEESEPEAVEEEIVEEAEPEEIEEAIEEESEPEAVEEEIVEEAAPEALEEAIAEETQPEIEAAPAAAIVEETQPEVEAAPAAAIVEETEPEAAPAAAIGEAITKETAEPEIETIIIASDETWGYYASDIEFSSIRAGEIFNRLLWEDEENPEKNTVAIDLDMEEVERYALPVIVKERLEVKEILFTQDGEPVLDFGQNFAGFVTFNSALSKGAKIHLSFADNFEDGVFEDGDENAGFTYISDGMPEVVGPHFTYFTGRYVKVSGWEGEVDPKDFVGCVIYSDMSRTGFVVTANEQLNEVYDELLSGQKRASVVMPEDGEPADIFAYAPAASYNMDTKEFLSQYLKGLKEQPVCDGNAYVPQLIWNLYRMYGDEELLAEHYELMTSWVDNVDARDEERNEKHFLYDFETDTDAWISMDQETDTAFIASACYFEAAKTASEAAAVLGKEQDAFRYGRLARRIKQAFLEEYYTGAGRLAIDTQTAYVLALQYGLFVDRARVADALKKRLAKDGGVVKCAPAAAPFICKVLADNHMTEQAYDILLDVSQKSFNNEVEFIYSYIAGIKPLEPGFKTIGLEPVPDGRIGYCLSTFDSPAGMIISNWTLNEDGSLNFHFEVPEGAKAKIVLPYYPVCAAGGNEVVVKQGSYDYAYMPSVVLKQTQEE